MNDSLSRSSPDDEILGQIMRDLDQPDGGSRKLDDYVRRHPNLASQIRELFQARELLDRSRPTTDIEQPKQLGAFKIVRLIGVGGMGEVYEAEQDQPRRKVVVKVIRQGRTSPESRERFLREQEMLARLHHTHIVPIHAAGEEGPLQYFAMPYIDGAALHHVVTTALKWKSSQPGSKTPSLAELAKDTKIADRTPSAPTGPDASTHPVTTSGPVPSAEVRSSRLTLSQDYFRSVAEVMADAAEALHHAHAQAPSIVHRDLKPSNIMVDKDGQCWIIDFGLAGYLNGHDGAAALGEQLAAGIEPATASGIMGTPQYMAPEQFDGKADSRTDVWGLGVTLYELLTLQRAFERESGESMPEICERIKSKEPPKPRELVSNVPVDLAAISRKAMRKQVSDRYQSAHELAKDLRRWLGLEPVRARRTSVVRRVGLWARRNKGWAVALIAGLLMIISGLGTGVLVAKSEAKISKQEAEFKGLEAKAARDAEKAAAAVAESATWEKEKFVLQSILDRRRENGWSKLGWHQFVKLAQLRKEPDLRDLAPPILVGLDAIENKDFKGGSSSVAFDAEGKRLLIGGMAKQRARLWNRTTGEETVSEQPGYGPVAFGVDGRPLQLVVKDAQTLRVWDLGSQKLVTDLSIPAEAKAEPFSTRNLVPMALSPDGRFVAVAVGIPEKKGQVHLWEVATGKALPPLPVMATALAFSTSTDDKKVLLALGDEQGQVTLWSLPDGKPIPGGPIQVGHRRLTVLAFGSHPMIHDAAAREKGALPWLLAAADTTTTITIWDLGTRRIKSFCRGSHHTIHALAFSPDGCVLASTGRQAARLWDCTTGQLLLRVGSRDWGTGLAFSPDGKNLAVSAANVFDQTGGVGVWDLEYGRGMRQLYGLSSRISKVKVSPDGRLLAALDDDWQVGIWDLAAGNLTRLIKVPQGRSSDNAALALSADGRYFAFSAGTQATLWELASGKATSWTLPEGLDDQMAFDSTGKRLILARREMDPGQKAPVFCFRDLLSKEPMKTYGLIPVAGKQIAGVALTSDGAFLALGLSTPGGKEPSSVMVVKGLTGEVLWSRKTPAPPGWQGLGIDASGKIVSFMTENERRAVLLDIETQKYIGAVGAVSPVLGPGGRYWFGPAGNHLGLFRNEEREPVLRITADPGAGASSFSLDGRFLALGDDNGTVTVMEIEEVRRRLATVGLGW